ncbi:oligopeptide/dipeptide ABC transporter ATP-binding protein [Kibdelosporangium banguiense]|uniref:Oligopeptide/dipeptide ABC transporter ATP-binding protein n=1 Tax=Kibdelosporangium banguiense TaxID=1365924 RepID=A0ABS4TZ54_9PSEU|nr:ABC transporter ATP-binding protein [Kibdelosporangium banguiense]MBP2329273.1 oligopeptide/dipeptide ABC transporter ATP-binding protein [Kibdelosporangium banguiense]
MTEPLLQIEDLRLELPVAGEMKTAIHGIGLEVRAGEAVGLVGESGSGKSLTARSIMRLLPHGARLSGDVRLGGVSVPPLDDNGLRRIRAHDVAMIFQDPRAHINPVHPIGDYLVEGLVLTRGMKRRDAERKVVDLLREVGIADAERRMRQRPWQLSGGLLQRVMIAGALTAEPSLILADEPTTALDVTTQEEVMAILDEQRRERALGLLFITHDLELAGAVCDRIAVMYAGRIVEQLPATHLRDDAAHPYTEALLAARPSLDVRRQRLVAVPGRPLSAFEAGEGCPFAARCPRAEERCRQERPVLRPVGESIVACHFSEDIRAAHTREESAHA